MIIRPGSGAYDRRLDGLPPIELQNMYVERTSPDVGADWVLLSFLGYTAFSGAPNIRGSHQLTDDIAGKFALELLLLSNDQVIGVGEGSAQVLDTGIVTPGSDARPVFASLRG